MEKQTFKTKENAVKAGKCFDCGCDITIKNKEIENGVLLEYNDNDEDFFILKCDKCYEKNQGISDYKKCEVYSRIVGYLRPVQNYNPGKKQEYEERKEYVAKV
jgi:hypothetical protein